MKKIASVMLVMTMMMLLCGNIFAIGLWSDDDCCDHDHGMMVTATSSCSHNGGYTHEYLGHQPKHGGYCEIYVNKTCNLCGTTWYIVANNVGPCSSICYPFHWQ